MEADARATREPDPILIDVEAFLQAFGMAPSSFGSRALNDPTFVYKLRDGREVRRETRKRIVEFMQAVRAEAQAA